SSVSPRKTTKLPILASSCCAVAVSIFLISFVRGSLTSRAKIMATGLLPFSQYRQCFSPADFPVTVSGGNGPGTVWPTFGPDRTHSPASARPARNEKPSRKAAEIFILIIATFSFYRKTNRRGVHTVPRTGRILGIQVIQSQAFDRTYAYIYPISCGNRSLIR